MMKRDKKAGTFFFHQKRKNGEKNRLKFIRPIRDDDPRRITLFIAAPATPRLAMPMPGTFISCGNLQTSKRKRRWEFYNYFIVAEMRKFFLKASHTQIYETLPRFLRQFTIIEPKFQSLMGIKKRI